MGKSSFLFFSSASMITASPTPISDKSKAITHNRSLILFYELTFSLRECRPAEVTFPVNKR